MRNLLNNGSTRPTKTADAVVIHNDGDVEVWYSDEAKVLHVVDIDSGFALTNRMKLRDIDHAREASAALGFSGEG